MNRLAQHRGAAGEAGGGELGRGDQKITRQSGIDHADRVKSVPQWIPAQRKMR
jgi:hypothetical protein